MMIPVKAINYECEWCHSIFLHEHDHDDSACKARREIEKIQELEYRSALHLAKERACNAAKKDKALVLLAHNNLIDEATERAISLFYDGANGGFVPHYHDDSLIAAAMIAAASEVK